MGLVVVVGFPVVVGGLVGLGVVGVGLVVVVVVVGVVVGPLVDVVILDGVVVFLVEVLSTAIYEPRCDKTGLRGFRPGPT